ncbi:hypothetical protein SteCoe_22605 [Stentor coeruleus]|uniref:EF-hand domain-containing protein n=1 Tax=Stentor coeruleus TaxID=5963 RepID=A0A1R2BLV1_9CILI|nr:hypothetical protein SteCoe_22605 [Stentor coeruleus]
MSNLVDMNRGQFQKIFDAHQQKDSLSYTDCLKICSSVKIFPDLLTSQEIRKIFISLSYNENGVERMNFFQFESFMKIIAKQAFSHCKNTTNYYGLLITHIKDNSEKRYGTVFDIQVPKNQSSSKVSYIRSNITKSITPKNKIQSSFFKPPSEKSFNKTLSNKNSSGKLSIPRTQGLYTLLSPKLKTLKSCMNKIKSSALTDRKDGYTSTCSTSPSPNKANIIFRINKAFTDFQTSCKKVDTTKILGQRVLQKIFTREKEAENNFLLKKMAFRIWTFYLL